MSESQNISVSSLSFGTMFKLIFWAGVCLWAAVSVLTVLMAFIAPQSISVNGEEATITAQALAAAPLFLVIGLICSALGAAIGAGLLKVFGKILPLGSVRFSS